MTDRAAEKISIGPWTVAVTRAPSGTLSIEVLLGGNLRAKFELYEGDGPRKSKSDARSKSAVDMEF